MGRRQWRVCINGEKEERKKWGASEHFCRVGKGAKEGLGLLEELGKEALGGHSSEITMHFKSLPNLLSYY